jgi:hypothetical protein
MEPLTPEVFTAIKRTVHAHPGFGFKVVTDSMAPVLPVGTTVKIQPVTNLLSLRRFDIVIFRDHGALTCHFVWSHNRIDVEPTLTTRSLKHTGVDDLPVSADALLGKVASHRISAYWRFKIGLRHLLGRGR